MINFVENMISLLAMMIIFQEKCFSYLPMMFFFCRKHDFLLEMVNIILYNGFPFTALYRSAGPIQVKYW
jgi:hypothetical protein